MHDVPPIDAPSTTPLADSAPPLRRRRRLWDLPTQAHELLLALCFEPDTLRREAARALGRMQGGVCELRGSDADVLYSLVHDIGHRNPLAESLHKQLNARHAAVLRHFALQRDPQALRSVWAESLPGPGMPAALWAVLTHPLGAELEKAILYQARDRVFSHTRRNLAQTRLQQVTAVQSAGAQQVVDALRTRLSQQQRDAATALDRARAEIATLRGELARQAAGAVQAVGVTAAAPKLGAVAAVEPSLRCRARAEVQPAGPPAAAAPPVAASSPITVDGSRVLCVGGIRHAVSRYRSRIEDLGGDFEHHDGGVEDGAQALDGRLQRADLVICQAGCINHEAYHRIKRHCERTGKPCLYLDRPSLSRFDRALATLVAQPAHRAAELRAQPVSGSRP